MCVPPPQRFDCQWAAGGIPWVEASETAKHPQCTAPHPCSREKSAETERPGLRDCTLPWREILVGKDGKCEKPNENISPSLTFLLHFHKTRYTLWDVYVQHAEGAKREMRAKINTHNNRNNPHLYNALLFIKGLPHINSTACSLGKEARKISLRVLPHFMHFQN